MSAPLRSASSTLGKSTRPVPGVTQTSRVGFAVFDDHIEVLDAHAHLDQIADALGVVDRVELSFGVEENITRVVPEAEILMADLLDALAALRPGSVEPAMGA